VILLKGWCWLVEGTFPAKCCEFSDEKASSTRPHDNLAPTFWWKIFPLHSNINLYALLIHLLTHQLSQQLMWCFS